MVSVTWVAVFPDGIGKIKTTWAVPDAQVVRDYFARSFPGIEYKILKILKL
jgi:hypothetical protein